MNRSLSRYRLVLGIFVAGLILSGLTAFPLLTELRLLGSWLGVTGSTDPATLDGLQFWIARVLRALEYDQAHFAFLAYGTDWLAFGHLAIAVFFIRPWLKPLESDWVLQCGLVCCAAVIPTAFIAGAVRGIPVYWRLIDCSFGAIGALPLFYCLRLTKQMRSANS